MRKFRFAGQSMIVMFDACDRQDVHCIRRSPAGIFLTCGKEYHFANRGESKYHPTLFSFDHNETLPVHAVIFKCDRRRGHGLGAKDAVPVPGLPPRNPLADVDEFHGLRGVKVDDLLRGAHALRSMARLHGGLLRKSLRKHTHWKAIHEQLSSVYAGGFDMCVMDGSLNVTKLFRSAGVKEVLVDPFHDNELDAANATLTRTFSPMYDECWSEPCACDTVSSDGEPSCQRIPFPMAATSNGVVCACPDFRTPSSPSGCAPYDACPTQPCGSCPSGIPGINCPSYLTRSMCEDFSDEDVDGEGMMKNSPAYPFPPTPSSYWSSPKLLGY